MEQTADLSDLLNRHGVKVILDYGVEAGEGENAFDEATREFIKVIQYSAKQKNIPYISVKVTAIARFGMLEKLDAAMHTSGKEDLQKSYTSAVEQLTAVEREEWNKCVARLIEISDSAARNNIGLLIDAEESWVQDPVDALAMQMTEKYNHGKCIIYNTFQMYRHDRLAFLKKSHTESVNKNVALGVKLVRGAYMEKERERALELNYRSPIHEDKISVDQDYNLGLDYCFSGIKNISLVVASHNEDSNLLCTQLMSQYGLDSHHPHIHFSQLYGMSDHITFNLAQNSYNVSKYIPFGPIKDVVPYLMRRAKENSSVAGQTGRELGLIRKELERRTATRGLKV